MDPEENEDHGNQNRYMSPSFKAIQGSLKCLYNIQDFDLAKIGEGFFSIVYKVI